MTLLTRKQAYQRLFALEDGRPVGDARAVLADLKRFSQSPDAPLARDGQGRIDPVASAVLVGRQEMFNRIMAMIQIDNRALFNLREDADA